MSDQFTEVTSESWFGRIGDSIKGFLFGFLLIPLSIILLFWNESRGVTTAKSLKEGASAVVAVEPAEVAPANDQKLIHVSGEATTSDVVSDPMFAVSATALRLTRMAEMYQWKEKESSQKHKKLGGGTDTETTYTYEKMWAHDRIDSSRFKHPEEHANPPEMLAHKNTIVAPHVTLGAFKVPASIVGKMPGDTPLAPTEDDLEKLKPDLRARAKVSNDGFYFGTDPSAPAIGDQRVTFKVLPPGVFSLLAQQTGDTLAPYPTKAGREIERVEAGSVSAPAMFEHAASENAILTWGLRLAGFIVMSLGIGLVVSPISVFADVIPFLGSLLGVGVFITALMLGMAGSLITIAVAWFVVRPILAGALVALAFAALLYSRRAGARRTAAAKGV